MDVIFQKTYFYDAKQLMKDSRSNEQLPNVEFRRQAAMVADTELGGNMRAAGLTDPNLHVENKSHLFEGVTCGIETMVLLDLNLQSCVKGHAQRHLSSRKTSELERFRFVRTSQLIFFIDFPRFES